MSFLSRDLCTQPFILREFRTSLSVGDHTSLAYHLLARARSSQNHEAERRSCLSVYTLTMKNPLVLMSGEGLACDRPADGRCPFVGVSP